MKKTRSAKQLFGLLICLTMVISLFAVFTVMAAADDQAHVCNNETFETPLGSDYKGGTLESGSYYLTANLNKIQGKVTIPAGADVRICLNGYYMTFVYGELHVKGSLTVYDCSEKQKGRIYGTAYTPIICENADSVLTFCGGGVSISSPMSIGRYLIDCQAGTLNLKAGSFMKLGTAILLRNKAVCNVYGGTIDGSYYAFQVGEKAADQPVLNIFDGTFGKHFTFGADVLKVCGGTVNISGGSYSKNTAVAYGGTVNITGGTHNAGVSNFGANVNITGGTFELGRVDGILNHSGSMLIRDVTVSNQNSAGYALRVEDGTVTLDNAVLQDSNTGAEVQGNAGATLILEGTTNITGNRQNLYLAAAKTVTVAEGFSGKVGVTTAANPTEEGSVAVTGTCDGDYSQYFTSDDSAYAVYNDQGVVKLNKPHAHTAEGSYQYLPSGWTGGTLTSGNYVLAGDVSLQTTIRIEAGNTVNLCLDGHVLDANGCQAINCSGTLHLCDCNSRQVTHIFTVGADDRSTWVLTADAASADVTYESLNGRPEAGRTIAVSGGVITDCTSAANPVIAVSTTGATPASATLDQIHVIGNAVSCSGVLQLGLKAQVEMTDCIIAGNYVAGSGMIYSAQASEKSKATFIMNGGHIQYNTSGQGSSAIRVDGTINLKDADITFNQSNSQKSAKYMHAVESIGSSDIYISGSTVIADNTANGNAGNLYLRTNQKVQLTEPTEQTEIRVTTEQEPGEASPTVPLTGTNTADYSSCFTSDGGYAVGILNPEDKIVCLAAGHIHSWSYSASGAEITAKCIGTFGSCEIGTDTLTISAPADLIQNGEAKAATLSAASLAGVTTLPEIQYQEKQADGTYGEKTTAAPVNAGTYQASITIGEGDQAVTASVEYTIKLTDQTEVTPDPDEPGEPDYDTCPKDAGCVYAKYTDADPQDWYHDGVHYCVQNGLMNGVSGTEFAPNQNLSRAMIVTILYRLEGEPAFMNSNIFSDVEAGSWYEKAVVWANSQGIVEGYGDGTFGPEDNVTREQLAVILYRYAKFKGIDTTAAEDTNILSYDDAADVSAWAVTAMQWACGSGIINGSDGCLVPQGDATRAEAAAMMQRFCVEVLKSAADADIMLRR